MAIRITIEKNEGVLGDVTIYGSMVYSMGINEARRFAKAFSDAIDVANRWQTGNQYVPPKLEKPPALGEPPAKPVGNGAQKRRGRKPKIKPEESNEEAVIG